MLDSQFSKRRASARHSMRSFSAQTAAWRSANGGSSVGDVCAPHVEEAHAARPAQELARGRREHVAAELRDVERHLARGLAGVEQERHAGLAAGAPHLARGVHEAAVRGDVGQHHEPGALAGEALAQGGDRDRPVGFARDHLDYGPAAARGLEQRQVVAGVFRARASGRGRPRGARTRRRPCRRHASRSRPPRSRRGSPRGVQRPPCRRCRRAQRRDPQPRSRRSRPRAAGARAAPRRRAPAAATSRRC